MTKHNYTSKLLQAALAILIAALPVLFAQTAFAERLEGPLRAAPEAYEHVSDDALHAQSQEEPRLTAQATGTTNYVNLSMTLSRMAQLQVSEGSSVKENGERCTYEDYLVGLDPNKRDLIEFADLRTKSGLTAAQIDAYIDSQAKGRSGKLHGMGAAFIKAESTYGISAAYLVSHAILETGWGTSALASGTYYDGSKAIKGNKYPAGTYYNFFGIGAVDNDAYNAGTNMAIQQGWTSPEAAVLGGAQWITKYYTYASKYPQPTLYAMKWDYARADDSGSSWHQFATGIHWLPEIGDIIKRVYARSGVEPTFNYIIPRYEGSSVPDTNVRSMYRMYNPNSGEHFYTANIAERQMLEDVGWTYEGIGWTAPSTSNDPVYRLYNKHGGEHHYTLNAAERDMLVDAGWNYEGIGWYSGGSTPLYRQYNPNEFANNHNYTVNTFERDHLISIGWRDEGIGWYGK